MFRREEERIRGALGARALRIEHTGSTGIPGRAAKPVIDLVLAVNDSGDEAAYLPDLQRAGYTLRIREPGWNQHRMFKGPYTDVNLHVFRPDVRKSIACSPSGIGCGQTSPIAISRRVLSKNSPGRQWKHVQNYADAKSGVIGEIMARALQKMS